MHTTANTVDRAKRAVTYCRISADKFGEQAGVERQTTDTARIATHHGFDIVERLVDNDRSASTYARKAREGFDRLLELLAHGAVDAVVAYDLDRITRRPDDLAPLIRAAEAGVRIYTAAGSVLDLSTGDGIFQARILLAVAEKEAGNASRRQKQKLRHDAEAGKPHWPMRPFGYTLAGDIVSDEAAVIRQMYKRVIAGDSCTSVAKWLIDSGVKSATGARWKSSTIKLLVTNPRNAGLRSYKGEIIGPASWTAIVDEATWRDACAALALRARPKRGGRVSLLTGAVRCGRCDRVMYRTGATDRAEYRCLKHGVNQGCGNSMMARPVDDLVTEMVLIKLGDVVGATREASVDGGEDVVDLGHQLDELAGMVGRGELTMREYKVAREPLQARLSAAEALLTRQTTSASLARLAGEGATLRDRWPDLDVEHQHRLVGLVLDHVRIDPSTTARLDLGRLHPKWKVP